MFEHAVFFPNKCLSMQVSSHANPSRHRDNKKPVLKNSLAPLGITLCPYSGVQSILHHCVFLFGKKRDSMKGSKEEEKNHFTDTYERMQDSFEVGAHLCKVQKIWPHQHSVAQHQRRRTMHLRRLEGWSSPLARRQ